MATKSVARGVRRAPGRSETGRRASGWLMVAGVLFLLGAGGYWAFSELTSWLIGQNRYLVSDEIAAVPLPTITLMPSPLPTWTVTPWPTATPTVMPAATAVGSFSPPVQIRIPAISVSRSIVALPFTKDASGLYTWNAKRLFRAGRSDLVGHLQGTASPGQVGNMILVGHNYGYGYNGVFVSLARLKAGQQVTVVNKTGETFTYQVTIVKRLKWRKKDFGELTQHLEFLSPGGPERVTLVSCAGADIEPFPERIYVVAERIK